jgi:hypothetical protein
MHAEQVDQIRAIFGKEPLETRRVIARWLFAKGKFDKTEETCKNDSTIGFTIDLKLFGAIATADKAE